MVITLVGCEKQTAEKNGLVIKSSIVKQSVNGWRVYTNPAFRYELRFPTDWKVADSGEDGLQAWFYSLAKDDKSLVTINSYSNWQENYIIEDFYARQPQDLFKAGYEKEVTKISEKNAYWFKGVKLPDGQADVVAIDLDDRIIEIIVWDKWDEARTVINSLKFYPNKVIGDLK